MDVDGVSFFQQVSGDDYILYQAHEPHVPKNCLDFLSHQSYNQEHGEKNRKQSITTKPGA